MKTNRIAQTIVASVCAIALSISTAEIAQASETKEPVSSCSQNVTVQSFQAPEWYSIDNIEAELSFLESLPEDIQDEEIALGLGITQPQERIAPLVIVAAIGCAVGVGGALFNTTWSSASSVAWSLAGVLVGCIPGASQAKLVSVILKHKTVIAKALKAVGASAAASALLKGDSAR